MSAVINRFTPDVIEQLFGLEAAENERETRLEEYFYKSRPFEELTSASFLKIAVGFKGTGKSALMRMAYLQDSRREEDVTIWISPDEFSSTFDEARKETTLNPIIKVWKAALWEVIAYSAAAKLPDASPEKAIKWLKSPRGIVRNPLQALLRQLGYERNFPKVNLYIDDLDRGWTATKGDVMALTGLINALRDITIASEGIRARISLRSDTYWDVRGSDQSMDKFESHEVWVQWSKSEMLVMLAKRVATFCGRKLDEQQLVKQHQRIIAKELDPVFEPVFQNTLGWNGEYTYKALLSLTRRPRDLVKLCTFAAREADTKGAFPIAGQHILDVAANYSAGRVQDLINEFRYVLPVNNLEGVLRAMAPTRKELDDVTLHNKWHYATDRLIRKLKDIRGRFNIPPSMSDLDLARLLYRIGFLNARKQVKDGPIERYSFDDKPHLLTKEAGDGGFSWEVHPAFRSALNPSQLLDWYRSVEFEPS